MCHEKKNKTHRISYFGRISFSMRQKLCEQGALVPCRYRYNRNAFKFSPRFFFRSISLSFSFVLFRESFFLFLFFRQSSVFTVQCSRVRSPNIILCPWLVFLSQFLAPFYVQWLNARARWPCHIGFGSECELCSIHRKWKITISGPSF